jgi:hypothetical protein
MSALPILLLGGAALMMMGGGKKKGSSSGSTASDKKAEKVVLAIRKKENPIYPFKDVAQLQEALIAVGQKLPKYGADGQWGEETEVAFQAFTKSGRRYGGAFEPKAVNWNSFPTGLNALAKAAAKDPSLLFTSKDSGSRLYCNIIEFTCPSGYECIPAFGQGQAPSGWEDVGLCIDKVLINVGRIPSPEEYVPGGFNEIFVDPKTGKAFIGGGWNFGTLHPWLQTPEFYVLPTLRNIGGLWKSMRKIAHGYITDEKRKHIRNIVQNYFSDLSVHPDRPPSPSEIGFAWNAFWFDKMADSLGIHERYSRWNQKGQGECRDFTDDLLEIYGWRIAGSVSWCSPFWARCPVERHSRGRLQGDFFLLMGRWLFAQAATKHLSVRYGNKSIKIAALQGRSDKAYQEIMSFISDSLCKYQKMSMSTDPGEFV